MKIIVVHNFYQQPGGEDQVFAAETALLEKNGHEVTRFTVRNDDVNNMGKLALAKATLWNKKIAGEIKALAMEKRPEVVHFHNTFPLTSPAAYYAARSQGAAVVQTIHNYRMICAAATLFREGSPCTKCVGSWLNLPAIAHKCYRDNRGASAVTAAMLNFHRLIGTYRNAVDLYFALTPFMKNLYVRGGFKPDQIVLKPNCVSPDPGQGAGEGGYALFVGRLTEEKGVRVLLEAWKRLGYSIPLKIVGDGPLKTEVEAAAVNPNIEYLGRKPIAEVHRIMGAAAAVVVPSTWYEGMPLTIIEAFATGTPVLVSDLGSMASLTDEGRTGWRFTPNDPDRLAGLVKQVFADPAQLQLLRPAVRAEYLGHYTEDAVYRRLIECYGQAIQMRSGQSFGDNPSSNVLSAATPQPDAAR